MLKKRLLSFFIALALVLTSVLPSATFASNVDAENEAVENIEEGAEEEQVSEDSDKIVCVSCESENVNLIIPLLNLYTCEDCGKYFTATNVTNKKGIDEQIDAVEEDAKKNIEAGMFGQSDGNTVVWHFVFGADLGNVSQGVPGNAWPNYDEINWGSIDTDIEDIAHYDFLGWSKTLGGAMKASDAGVNYRVGQTYTSGRVAFSVFAKHKYTMAVEGYDDAKVTYGENFVLPASPTLEEGQEFKGWKDADGVEYAAGDTIENVERDMEFFAIVEACEYNVKVGDEDATKIVYGDTVTLPEEYNDIEGKTFTGWKDQQGNVYDKGEDVVIKGNKNFTPVYEDVYYDVYVNNEKKASVKHGDKFTLPSDFEVGETEVFTGWEDEDGNTYDKGEKVAIYGEMKFTPAVGTKELRTVTFDSNGGSEVEAQEVYDGLKATKPENPKKEHYNFVKWTLGGVEYNFNAAVTSDITLKATWEAKKYTVNVDGDESEVAYGDKITLPTTKASSDVTKVFDDYVDEDGNHYEGGKQVTIDGPKTFTAQFKEKNKIFVRYFDGSTELTDLKEEVYEGFKATEKSLSDKEHYLFKGWKTSAGSAYNFGAAVTSEVKLYAIWEAKKYTVNVDGDEQEVAYDDKITLPTTKESTDDTKVFDDYVDESGNHYAGGAEVRIDGPKTFTATFKNKNKYAVKYFDGTTELTDLKEEVYEGFKATEKSLSDKEHYLFKGWKTSTGSVYNFNTAVISELELHAIWEAKKYTVNVDGDEQEVAYGDKITLPTTKESTDDTKVFDDYVDESGNHYAGGAEVRIDGPKTFTATFKDAKTIAVRYFDGINELTNLKEEVYEGAKAIRPAVDPTKAHYTFDEWRLNDNSVFNFDTEITGEVKIYASWILDTYKVTVDGNEQYIGYNTTFTLPYAPSVPKSKKFLGYKKAEDGVLYPARKNIIVLEEMTFTSEVADRKLYTVRFYDDNGTEYTSYRKSEYEGYSISSPTTPSKDRKKFQYWADRYGNKYNFGSALTSNIDLYAVWKNIYMFRIDYNNSAYNSSTRTYYQAMCLEGDIVKITLPTFESNFTKYTGSKEYSKDSAKIYSGGSYMFLGFAKDDHSNPKSAQYRGGETIEIAMTKDITIYGVWRIDNFKGKALSLSYNGVSYKAGSGGKSKKITKVSVQHGSGETQVYVLPDANDKAKKATSKKFKGWAISSTATTPDFKVGDIYICSGASDSNTLYAVWR